MLRKLVCTLTRWNITSIMKKPSNTAEIQINRRAKTFTVNFYGRIYSIKYKTSYKIADDLLLYDKISLFAVEDLCAMLCIDEAVVKRVCSLKYITRYWFEVILAAVEVTPRITAGFNKLANVEL